MVAATVGAYNVARAELLPTPLKSHYTLNLRDVARVVQGIVLADTSTFRQRSDMMLLWAHEVLRVFYDRARTATRSNPCCLLATSCAP